MDMTPQIPRWVTIVAGIALALCLVLANALLSVRASATNLGLYQDLWVELGVTADTGMSLEDLTRAGKALIDYLVGKTDSPQLSATIDGRERLLFNQKELRHLEDVKDLFTTGFTVEWLSTAAAFAIAVLLTTSGKHKAASIALYAAALLSIIVLAVLALSAASDFTGWWTQFHLLTFTNDLWLLDPQTDWLIRMFPEPFFFALVKRAGIHAAVTALVLALAGFVIGLIGRKRRRTL
jgi:integral membrane protein (TIGR01906 family)